MTRLIFGTWALDGTLQLRALIWSLSLHDQQEQQQLRKGTTRPLVGSAGGVPASIYTQTLLVSVGAFRLRVCEA